MAAPKELNFVFKMDQKMLFESFKTSEDYLTSPFMFNTIETCLCIMLKNYLIDYLRNSLKMCPEEKLYVSKKVIIETAIKYKNCVQD